MLVVSLPPSPRAHRGKGLAAFLKAIGYLIPLMDNESANYYTREVMVILVREFQSPDEEMRKIVLKVCMYVCVYVQLEEYFFVIVGSEAMLYDRWGGASLHQGRDLATLL